MGMADLPAKVRAKFSRQSPAPSPLSTVEPAPQEPEEDPGHGDLNNHGRGPDPDLNPHRRRKNTWSLRSRRADRPHPRRSLLTMDQQQQQREDARVGSRGSVTTAESNTRTGSHSNSNSNHLSNLQHNTTPAASDERGGSQSKAGNDRRRFVSTSTAPSRLLDTPREIIDDDHNDHNDSNSSSRTTNTSEGRAKRRDRVTGTDGDPRTSRFYHSDPNPIAPLPSAIDPTSPSNAPSPERDRNTRSVLAEYEAEQEVHADTIPRRQLSRGHSSASYQSSSNDTPKPPGPTRKQSLLPQQQTALIRSLLGPGDLSAQLSEESDNYPVFSQGFNDADLAPSMVSRKIWVKRPGASATLVTILEDNLVDDVRDMILKKYANTLGRSFDSPDVTLRVVPRENRQERTLGPEEPICQVLDGYFPGGQTVDEALVIDVPLRRTPRPSPQAVPMGRYYQEEDRRPPEAASEYFPPMPVPTAPSPHLPASHSMSVLTTGHVPNLPSPGAGRRAHHRDRPRLPRQHTASPAVISGQPQLPPQHNDNSGAVPVAPPLPSPPAPQQNGLAQIQQVAPPPRISSPRPPSRPKKIKKTNSDHPSFPAGMLNGAVPPINVLIVEDNIINLKLLEAFMKRLKVRSQNAMNGREAVTKWRAGGFHLVLMDIQLPIMNGLDATKEIRRLERLNSIGVFTSSAGSSAPPEIESYEPKGDDKLSNLNLFKSPVIIVALTASSLQSDRHEALAAGCNDFLTKPVNFVWLERKVMEWGCMQALIDYDGWRQWKDFSQDSRDDDSKDGKGKGSTGSGTSSGKKKKHRPSAGSSPSASTSHIPTKDVIEPVGLGVDSGDASRSPNHM